MSCNCGAADNPEQACTCVAGIDAPQPRHGNGVPSVDSTDRAGRLYFQDDTTPAGEVWFFDGVSWTDLGYSLQGDTGAAGSAGAVVVYNSAGSPTAFNSVGLTTIDTQTATLETNGSYLEIENDASVTVGNANNHNRITVGGVIVYENTPTVWGIANQKSITRVTRVNATTIQFQYETWLTATFLQPIATTFYFSTSTNGVADMDTNPLTIVLEWGGIGTSRALIITKYVK